MNVPTECPVCGAYSLSHDEQSSILLAVTDVLVYKALEALGKWIVRADRSRFNQMNECSLALYEAHLIWQPEEAMIDKALRGAWDVVPAMLTVHGSCGASATQVTDMLDSYVHDLAITGTAHSLPELFYRLHTRLPVYLKQETVDA